MDVTRHTLLRLCGRAVAYAATIFATSDALPIGYFRQVRACGAVGTTRHAP